MENFDKDDDRLESEPFIQKNLIKESKSQNALEENETVDDH